MACNFLIEQFRLEHFRIFNSLLELDRSAFGKEGYRTEISIRGFMKNSWTQYMTVVYLPLLVETV